MTEIHQRYQGELSFPWSYVLKLVFEVGVSSIVNNPTLDSDYNLYLVAMTPEQVLKFTSALQAGLDLIYPETWQTDLETWLYARELVNTLSYVNPLDGDIVAICDAVAECVENDPGLQDAIRNFLIGDMQFGDFIRQSVEQALADGGGLTSFEPNIDGLDYVYGGIVGAQPIYESLIDEFEAAAVTAVNVAEILANIPQVKFLPTEAVGQLQAGLDIGVALVAAFLRNPSTVEAFNCGVFDSVCLRGEPYFMSRDDVTAGFDAIESLPGSPIPTIVDLCKTFFSYDKYMQYWEINSDTADNNWEALCSCLGAQTITYDFTQESGGAPNTIYGASWVARHGTYVSGQGYVSFYFGNDFHLVSPSKSDFPYQKIVEAVVQFTVNGDEPGENNNRILFLVNPVVEVENIVGSYSSADSPTTFSSNITLEPGQSYSPEFRHSGASSTITIQKITVTFDPT